jgi:hypothetical protein
MDKSRYAVVALNARGYLLDVAEQDLIREIAKQRQLLWFEPKRISLGRWLVNAFQTSRQAPYRAIGLASFFVIDTPNLPFLRDWYLTNQIRRRVRQITSERLPLILCCFGGIGQWRTSFVSLTKLLEAKAIMVWDGDDMVHSLSRTLTQSQGKQCQRLLLTTELYSEQVARQYQTVCPAKRLPILADVADVHCGSEYDTTLNVPIDGVPFVVLEQVVKVLPALASQWGSVRFQFFYQQERTSTRQNLDRLALAMNVEQSIDWFLIDPDQPLPRVSGVVLSLRQGNALWRDYCWALLSHTGFIALESNGADNWSECFTVSSSLDDLMSAFSKARHIKPSADSMFITPEKPKQIVAKLVKMMNTLIG